MHSGEERNGMRGKGVSVGPDESVVSERVRGGNASEKTACIG